uniref:Stum, mechanosensory transduction mediator homolog n=1 Tax=Felis catus TaxID=9685 RepID=A0ABI7WLN3_FELCA
MEPSHKDAETAAAAAAADPRAASSSSGVVVQVREKKGPLRAAIPYMPFPVAVICLFLNTFVPGLGTFVSAFAVLCGARTDLPDRHVCCVFWLNIAAALIQTLTAIVMVGWIMSIFWGMDMVILAKLEQTVLKCVWNQKRPQIEKATLRKKTEAGGITIPDFKLCHKAVIIKTLAQKETHRSMEENREPRNEPTNLWPTNLGQSRKEYAVEKRLFSKWCWENWTATQRKMNLGHFLTSYTTINSKWMKDLNVRQEAIKILAEKAGKKTSLILAAATSYSTRLRRQGKQKPK